MDMIDGLYQDRTDRRKYVWKNNHRGTFVIFCSELSKSSDYFRGCWSFYAQDKDYVSKLLLPKQFLISTEENEECLLPL